MVIILGSSMAAVPFAARALVGTLPDAVMAGVVDTPVTLKEMIEDFLRQVPEASSMIENIMQTGASTFIMHCRESRQAEALLHTGLTFRSYPIKFVAAPNTQWVKLTRVMYGTTENAIKSRLADYGTVLKMRREMVHGVGISVYSVKMELRKPIPSRLTIANFPVNVFYRGQVQQCFRCEQTGHLSKSCPFKKSSGAPPPGITGDSVITPPSGVNQESVHPGPGVSTHGPNSTPDGSVTSDGAQTSISPALQSSELVPAMDTSPPSLSDEASETPSSVSTPVNPDTGKRQRKQSSEATPSKKDKQDCPSYKHYEREMIRGRILATKLSDKDRRDRDALLQRIPDDKLPRYRAMFKFRHPEWMKKILSRDDKVLQDICKLRWPDYGVSLSPDLFKPTFPVGTPPPDLPYEHYELIRTYMEARNQFPHLPDLPEDAKKDIDGLPVDTLKVFENFYATTHPEAMSGVDDKTRDAIIGSFISRTPISFER